MTHYRWDKWLKALPLLILPATAAVAITRGDAQKDVQARVSEKISALDAGWAKLDFDVRDVRLGGDAPSQDAIDAAKQAISGTYGVRTVIDAVRVVAPPPPVSLKAPTIESLVTNNPQPEIKGTWEQGIAKTLGVSVAGTAYAWGKDAALTSTSGTWTLKPATPLADGSYDVTAEVSDGLYPAVGTVAPAKITVDTLKPATPAVMPPVQGAIWPYSLVGTWAEGDAASLVAKFAGKVFTLGKDDALTSDGKGNWRLGPALDLKPGSYDLTLETADRAGNISTATAPAAVVVAEAPAPVAQPVPTPVVKQMAAPTLKIPAMIMDARPTLEGTWSQGVAIGLSVTLGPTTYVLGKDAALASDAAGNWKLKSESVLKDGAYDVRVETIDAAGKKLAVTPNPRIVVDAAGPASPTVGFVASESSPATITGTWAEGDATSLGISIPKAGLAAVLGDGGSALVSDGTGNWTFTNPKILQPGSYDVVVDTADGMGRKSSDQTRFEINIKTPAAPVATTAAIVEQTAPTIGLYAGEQSPASISGTWDEPNAKGLKVSIPGANLSATLGADAAFTSAKGAWTLSLAQKLPPGIYNVVAESTDAAGKMLADTTTAEIYVKAPPPPPPPPPYDCAGVLAKIANVFPVRFGFNHDGLASPYDLALNQYVALLKDPRCATEKAEIAGHADYYGPRLYNQALSESRARFVLKTLVAAGVDASRLGVKGFSELEPVDGEKSIDARKKNRRVEINFVK